VCYAQWVEDEALECKFVEGEGKIVEDIITGAIAMPRVEKSNCPSTLV